MIKIIELIELAGVKLANFKIHCATGNNPSPLEAFFDGNFRQWQEHQNQKNFQCENILSLIHLDKDLWLFAGVFVVEGFKSGTWKNKPCYRYETQEVDGLDHLTGKAVVKFNKPFRASYLRGAKYANNLLVSEIRPQRMSIGDFPGFNSVLLTHRMLQTLVRESDPTWRTALSNVAGIYLITDTSSGKHYVGSAYGSEGIWQRWSVYVKNGHGGNKELRNLLHNREYHVDNFQYSLLEVCDLNSSDEYIIAREIHWKTVLRSREFGLNKN